MRVAGRVLLQAVVLSAVACGVGLIFNAARSHGLSVVADAPYNIYKPCPMMSAEATALGLDELGDDLSGLVIIDARRKKEFALARIPGSRSLPYHPLDATDPALIAELKALGPSRVLVVGDTQIDSGRLLSAEMAQAGCLGVRYLSGGFPAWEKAGRAVEREGQP